MTVSKYPLEAKPSNCLNPLKRQSDYATVIVQRLGWNACEIYDFFSLFSPVASKIPSLSLIFNIFGMIHVNQLRFLRASFNCALLFFVTLENYQLLYLQILLLIHSFFSLLSPPISISCMFNHLILSHSSRTLCLFPLLFSF